MTYNGEDIPYLGMWAELRKNYLLEEKPEDYAELVEEKMVIEYLVAIEERYSKRFDELVEQQMEREGVDEKLKVENPLKWIGLVNNIRSCVKEILIEELCS
ncbi:MAG: TnpV protein [Selenomonadaceae bacterium]|nr:TnpV protein [Selenomonadaceae bacterium]